MANSDPNWEELASLLLELTASEVKDFAESHDDEEYYGFFFDCHSEYGQVLLCVNTEEAHQRSLEEYRKRWAPKRCARSSIKYGLAIHLAPRSWAAVARSSSACPLAMTTF